MIEPDCRCMKSKKMCDKCRAEADAVHIRWAAERKNKLATGAISCATVSTPEPIDPLAE